MKWIIALLLLLVVVSNLFWFLGRLDSAVTIAYQEQQIYELSETQKQLMAIFPGVAQALNKEEVIELSSNYTNQAIYVKNGCTWVGWLGFRFGKDSKLQFVSPVWSYDNMDPCYASP